MQVVERKSSWKLSSPSWRSLNWRWEPLLSYHTSESPCWPRKPFSLHWSPWLSPHSSDSDPSGLRAQTPQHTTQGGTQATSAHGHPQQPMVGLPEGGMTATVTTTPEPTSRSLATTKSPLAINACQITHYIIT